MKTCKHLFPVCLSLIVLCVAITGPSHARAAEPKAPAVTKLPGGEPAAHLDYTPGKPPALWSVALAETIMARYPDYRRAYWKPWNYAEGYVLTAFERIYRDTGDRRYMDYVKKLVDNFVAADGKFNGSNLNNLDDFMAGTSIVAVYDYTHEPRYKTAATQIRKAFDPYPRTDGQFWHNASGSVMWIDGVFMGQMFALRYGASIGDSDYCFDEAAKQILTCARHSEKGKSGLYLHAWTDQAAKYKWADPKTGLSPEVWSEGLGWYALVVADALAVMPKDQPRRAAVEDVYRRLAAGLKREQDPQTGGWFMIVDKGSEPGNWIDPSGTAMFVYSLQRGIELGLLDAQGYAPVVQRGYQKLLTFATVNEHGLVDVAGGGDGIGIKNSFADYVKFRRQVNAKETVGGFLWATTIMERSKLEAMKR